MANIVYVCNYILEDVLKERNCRSTFSQACNNKVSTIRRVLESYGHYVRVLSNGLTNNSKFRYFRSFTSKFDKNLIYGGILDIPLLNTISSIISMFFIIYRLNRIKKIDIIIFYNYKPETAFVAFLSKLLLRRRIIIDYEDGYFSLKGISVFKRIIFTLTEKAVSNAVNGAILVTTGLISRIGNKKYVVIRSITNEEILYHPLKESRQENNPPIIMYSGSLDETRGIKLLLGSLKYIKRDFVLVISGSGPLVDYVINFNDNRVKYLGYLQYEELKKHLIQADILVNPQKSKDSFGNTSFPSKLFDYIATGNLVVSSRVSDVESVLSDEFLYNSDNPEDLAVKLTEMLDNRKSIIRKSLIMRSALENTFSQVSFKLDNFLATILESN